MSPSGLLAPDFAEVVADCVVGWFCQGFLVLVSIGSFVAEFVVSLRYLPYYICVYVNNNIDIECMCASSSSGRRAV